MSTYNGQLFPKKPKYDKWKKLGEYLEELAKNAGKGTVTAQVALMVVKRMRVLENNEKYYNEKYYDKEKRKK